MHRTYYVDICVITVYVMFWNCDCLQFLIVWLIVIVIGQNSSLYYSLM